MKYHKRNVKLNINGQIIDAKCFMTRKAAGNFMARNRGYSIVFFKAGEYYVSKI